MLGMSEQRKVRCDGGIDRPYESVREALHRLPRKSTPEAALHLNWIHDQAAASGLPAVTRASLGWGRQEDVRTFPVNSAEIYAMQVSRSETRLELEGHCASCGAGEETASGDRNAEVWLQTLLGTIVDRLQREIEGSK
jgi:hypothetical protein